jgi:predicted GIY-YIG superfamily endonuclease
LRVHVRQSSQRDDLYRRHVQSTAPRVRAPRGLGEGVLVKVWLQAFVWYELHATMTDAITREKQIKAGSREKKLALIESVNPDWMDLYETLI